MLSLLQAIGFTALNGTKDLRAEDIQALLHNASEKGFCRWENIPFRKLWKPNQFKPSHLRFTILSFFIKWAVLDEVIAQKWNLNYVCTSFAKGGKTWKMSFFVYLLYIRECVYMPASLTFLCNLFSSLLQY